jgi:tetratricopeptide (TPR) repeat protein
MNSKKKYSLLILVLAAIALTGISCNTIKPANNTIDINGMIYDFSNRPVAYCEIALGELYTGITDISGRFTLPRIPPGTYTITGYKEGYETYTDEIMIREKGQIVYIRIPSQIQLLNLVDEALIAMNFDAAEEYVQRAYQIDKNNIEMLFYYATIKFRQHMYDEAIVFLMAAKNLGSKDAYVDRFLAVLWGLADAEN